MSSGTASRSASMRRSESQIGRDLGSPKCKRAADFFGCSARALWPPAQLRISPVDPFQHISHLGRRDRHRAIRRRGPDELAAVQALGVQRHARPVMPKNLARSPRRPRNIHEQAYLILQMNTNSTQLNRNSIETHISDAGRQIQNHAGMGAPGLCQQRVDGSSAWNPSCVRIGSRSAGARIAVEIEVGIRINREIVEITCCRAKIVSKHPNATASAICADIGIGSDCQ